MSQELFDISIIFCLHFVGDFLLQSRSMGRNKGKSILWLFAHVFVYTTFLFWGWSSFIGFSEYSFYVMFGVYHLIFITHFLTDLITSKISGYAYIKCTDNNLSKKLKYRWEYMFWSIIGLDQLIHIISLILIYNYLN